MRRAGRLGTVLRVRRIAEEAARHALAVSVKERLDAQAAEDRAWAGYARDGYLRVPPPGGPAPAGDWLAAEALRSLAADSVHAAVGEARAAEARFAERSAAWQERAGALSVIERLLQRRSEEEALLDRRAEQAAADDLSGMRWARFGL